jgi:hypothetical protein
MAKLTTNNKDIDMSAPISGQKLSASQQYAQTYQSARQTAPRSCSATSAD